MAGSKQKSMSHPTFAEGGSGHMYGKTGVGTQKPGTTNGANRESSAGKFAQGGSAHGMVGKTGAQVAKPGTSNPQGGKAGNATGSGGGRRGTGTSMDNG